MTTIVLSEDTPAGTYTLAPVMLSTVGIPANANGVDLSQYNDVKDFLSMKNSGVGVCIHRATKGAVGLDAQYLNRWQEIVQTGFAFHGIYHLFIPGVSGKSQYTNLMEATKGDFGNYPLTVDVEPIPSTQTYPDPLNQIISPLRELLELIRARSVYRPVVYTADWATQRMGLTKENWLLDYALHFAEYTTGKGFVLPEPWRSAGKQYFAWQHWNMGSVPGVIGNVDLDRFTGQPFQVG